MYKFLKNVFNLKIKVTISSKNEISDQYFIPYLNRKISEMEKGICLNKGRHYARNSIANYRKVLGVWERFELSPGEKPLRFSDISLATYSRFMQFCDIEGYKESTKYQYIALVKAIMNSAVEDGCSCNTIHNTKGFVTHCEGVQDYKNIYLTKDEIEAIEKVSLPKGSLLDKARDVFLSGCYTGQRFSDYSNISLNEFEAITIEGVEYKALRKRQKKTGNTVLIPILNNNLFSIIEKWGGCLPKISISALNEKIKIVCRMAKINTPVLLKGRKTSGSKYAYGRKWELVSSHTARRSCLTNLHLEGKLTPEQIRSISGHKSEKTYRQYLCQSDEEEAREILKKYKL